MHLHTYCTKSTNEHRTYEFVSDGPKGSIKKLIKFEEMGYNLYNLCFGDWEETTQSIDDKARSNNHDRDKVIATVASTVMSFIKYYPNATIFAKGSTPARTRLYQMGILANWQEIGIFLHVKGYIDEEWQPIQKHINYNAFLARIK